MKKKLTLDMDTLQVESFVSSPAMGGHGTVQAHEDGVAAASVSWCQSCFTLNGANSCAGPITACRCA